ncbi:chloride channel protein [Streptomyces antnestii]|uniref:Chloride channel protein n=1 Tax=Streptomyces antnestii TaxID=2494256 RepID=A0A3S2W4X8_9ACTN|nr:chloride channel protein [Streptomyces sp. San01]RVU28032.1 chloride channel protein [Streptomyces sp. San01]
MTAADGPAPGSPAEDASADAAQQVLLSGRYLRVLLLSLLLGVPIALACFFFVGLQHSLQHEVWTSLPKAVGYKEAPWWWPLPALALAGVILAPIVTRMPGGGGHLPVNGLGGSGRPIGPRELPGVVLAALATLPLGVVLGPEAPLMAMGSGLALLAVRRFDVTNPQTAAIVATAGSTAAISTILGGPIVAAILVVEAAGLAGARLAVLLLPCLIASAAGAVVFTGFGTWTGLSVGGLALPTVPPLVTPDAGDFLWGVPLAVVIAGVITVTHRLGYVTSRWTAGRRTTLRTLACAVAVGICLTAYALLTGRSPEEAALSGQATLGDLAANTGVWPVGALLALVVCKGLAWGISLGSLRGGPIFPALLLGAAGGVACAGLPGLGATPALALGICAAGTAVMGLPLCSAVLTVLLMGKDAHDQTPLIVTAAVVAHLTVLFVNRGHAADAQPDHTA